MDAPPLPREQFPVSDRYCYLNHAGVAPLPRAAGEVGTAFLDDFVAHGAVGFADWDERMEATRVGAAELMGVPADDVAFVKNTTEGMAFVASGLTWTPGDRVLAPAGEFPSTVYPWLGLRDLGVEVDLLRPVGPEGAYPLDAFAAALAERPVKVVAVSWVNFGRGWRLDLAALAELCHAHGALLCVDAIQGLGVVPAAFADWGVDFAAADAHKWLLGPIGTGVLYVAEHRRNLLRPIEPGWASVAHRADYDRLELVYDESARRFEGGSQTIGTIVQMGASFDLLRAAGVERIHAHVAALLDHLAEGLRGAGATVVTTDDHDHRAGHLTFTVEGRDPQAIWEHLQAASVVGAARGGGVRLAPHGYTTDDDIDRAVDAVRDAIRAPAG